MTDPIWKRWQELRADESMKWQHSVVKVNDTSWSVDYFPKSKRLYVRSDTSCFARENSEFAEYLAINERTEVNNELLTQLGFTKC